MFPLKRKIAKVPVVPVYFLSTGAFFDYSLPIITPPSLPHVTAMLLSCDVP